MTAVPSPFTGDNFEEAKHTADERGILARKMTRESLARGGDEYIRLVGKEAIMKQVELMKLTIQSMNELTGSTVRFSIPTIDAMIIAIGLVPAKIGSDIIGRTPYRDLQIMMQAMKRILEIERDEKVAEQTPPVVPSS